MPGLLHAGVSLSRQESGRLNAWRHGRPMPWRLMEARRFTTPLTRQGGAHRRPGLSHAAPVHGAGGHDEIGRHERSPMRNGGGEGGGMEHTCHSPVLRTSSLSPIRRSSPVPWAWWSRVPWGWISASLWILVWSRGTADACGSTNLGLGVRCVLSRQHHVPSSSPDVAPKRSCYPSAVHATPSVIPFAPRPGVRLRHPHRGGVRRVPD